MAPPRQGYRFSRVVVLPYVPESILVSPSGAHVAIVAPDHLDVWPASAPAGEPGALRTLVAFQPRGGRHLPVLTERGIRWGLYETDWSGAEISDRHMSAVSDRAFELAAWVAPGVDLSIAQNLGTLSTARGLSVQVRQTTPQGDTVSRWAFSLPGLGTGAALPDGRIAVASRGGRLMLLSATGDHATGAATPLFDRETGLAIYALSFTEAGLVALFAEGPAAGSELLGLPPPGRSSPDPWTTGVLCVNATGEELWRAKVPFAVTAPAIDGAGGRVILAGRGLAAIEQGRTVWQSETDEQTFVTALADGTLVIALNASLRILDRGGQVLLHQTPLKEADQAAPPPFVTAPSIGPDGSVWIATARHLYVAR